MSINNKYIEEIEKDGEYKYIKVFKKNDVLPNGKVVGKNIYLQIEHSYCKSIYTVSMTSIIYKKTKCSKCCGSYEASFAFYIEVEMGLKLEDIWDFDKNITSPYDVSKCSAKKVWIKCQNEEVNELNGLMKKDYHGSYEISCANYFNGKRCSYCQNKKIHTYDSFGYHNFDKVLSWHPDNEISPFRVARGSSSKVNKFICKECEHEWIPVLNSVYRGQWCPVCSTSKGEKKVKTWLDANNIRYIYDKPYFEDLLSDLGNPLRPDFILPNEKIWIEYDGEFHYKDFYKDGRYEVLKYHDRLKNKYAKMHGWKMIRIPYWEFNNIEDILTKELI